MQKIDVFVRGDDATGYNVSWKWPGGVKEQPSGHFRTFGQAIAETERLEREKGATND